MILKQEKYHEMYYMTKLIQNGQINSKCKNNFQEYSLIGIYFVYSDFAFNIGTGSSHLTSCQNNLTFVSSVRYILEAVLLIT